MADQAEDGIVRMFREAADQHEALERQFLERASAVESLADHYRVTARQHGAEAAALRAEAETLANSITASTPEAALTPVVPGSGADVPLHDSVPTVTGSTGRSQGPSWRTRIVSVMAEDPDREWSVREVVTRCDGPSMRDPDGRRLEVARKTLRRMVASAEVERTSRGRYRLPSEKGRSQQDA